MLALFSCAPNSEKHISTNKIEKADIEFNIESAEKVIKIAKDVSSGKIIDQTRWDELFSSAGYKNYLVYSDSSQKREMIKEAMITVFDTSKKELLDSLLNEHVVLDRNFMKLLLIQNFNGLKLNLNQAEAFLQNTDFKQVLINSDSLAQSFLPLSATDSLPNLYPVFVVISDPDGRVLNNSIVIDLYLMLEMGKEGLAKFIAHEFHHNYRKIASREYENPLMIELNKLHQEALADLIDKEKPPVLKLGLFPEFMLKAYNSDYLNTPDNLKTLDSLVVGYLKNEIEESEYKESINNIFKFGGHTTGIYMSFLIEETIGKDKLIENYNNPIEFIRVYNSVASELENEFIFSTDFIDYISRLESQAITNAKNEYAH